MYYESYRKKPKRKKSGRRQRLTFGEWLSQGLLKLLALALTVVLISAGLLYALPPSLFAVEPEGMTLALTDGLPASCLNVLLLGTDELRENAQRSDSVMIASIGYGRFRLTSVMRDTMVEIPGHGRGKLNSAFSFGGAELTMRTLNQNFGLNIMHYAQVDFATLAAVVDAIGGVDITITDAEREQININTKKSRRVFEPLGYTPREVTQYGENIHLDGLQALSYARIRKIDSDFARTGRQRVLLAAILKRLRANCWNPVMLTRLAQTVMRSVRTNMSALQILSLGEKALLAGEPGQLRLPVEGSYTDDGSRLNITNPSANRDAFVRFVYE